MYTQLLNPVIRPFRAFWGFFLLAASLACVRASAQPYVYTTNTLGNAISIIDARTYNLVTSVSTGSMTYPSQVALSPDGALLYASNRGNNTVSVISTADRRLLKTINVGSTPSGLGVTPDGAFVYVANQGSDTISVINAATESVNATISVAAGPLGVAVTPDGSRVWVTSGTANEISVISTSTNQLVSKIPAMSNPTSMAFTPDGARAYVTNAYADTVGVYNVAAGTIAKTIVVSGQPISVAISRDGSRAYVAGQASRSLYVIDTSSNQSIGTIPVGNMPAGVAVSADGTRVWVSNAGDWSLSVIDTVNNAVVSTLPGLAYDPQGIVIAASAPPAASVSLTPAAASLRSGESQQFAATVTGSTDRDVTWSVNPPLGTISTTGLYLAPTQIGSAQTVTVTARAVFDSTKSATAVINLIPSVEIALTPSSSTVTASRTAQFTATITNTANRGVIWTLSPSVGAISASGLYTAPSSITALQTVTVTATSMADSTKSASGLITLTPPAAGFTPIRVNAGGAAYRDSNGNLWSADTGSAGGAVYAKPNTVSGTSMQPLYQDERFWNSGAAQYEFNVPNGSYQVNLKFAELNPNDPGRFFNVLINSAQVLNNFSPREAAGGNNIAVDKGFAVNVTGGRITIAFTAIQSTPTISAIEIVQPGAAFQPIRINAGGAAYIDGSGNAWSADQNYMGGAVFTRSNPISGTSTGALYQNERFWSGSGQYQFTVPSGTYQVKLKFAELNPVDSGRTFNVSINGTQVLTNFCPYAAAGGVYIAIDQSFPVTVTAGQITIVFTGVVSTPTVSAIEILKVS